MIAPVLAATSCHGTMLAWCSSSEMAISSPGLRNLPLFCVRLGTNKKKKREREEEVRFFSYFEERRKPTSLSLLLSLVLSLQNAKNSKTKAHPQLLATRLIPSVAFFVKTTSLSLPALINCPTLALAFS